MIYDSLIFDLDGTLWNAGALSAAAWNTGLLKLKIPRTVSIAQIASVAGKPYRDCVTTLLPDIEPSRLEEVVSTLNSEERAEFDRRGGTLYPGVSNGLAELARTFRLFIVSNCQDWYLEAFWKHSGLRSHFFDSECHGRSPLPKGENIRLVIERNHLANPAYIGDTVSDQQAAALASVDFFHVAYGFGTAETNRSFGSFSDLKDQLIFKHFQPWPPMRKG